MAHAPLAPLQLPLPIAHGARVLLFPNVPTVISDSEFDEFHRRLGGLLAEPLDLLGTENRRTLLSWRRDRSGLLCVRIQRQFARADDRTIHALVQFIRRTDGESAQRLRDFASGFCVPAATRRRARVAHPAGEHHDLRLHFERQRREHFEDTFQARIGWARNAVRGRRSIRLGSWSSDERLIRIHPLLDGSTVPDFVVGFVVFHEMLHGALGVALSEGRRVFHSQEFRRRERAHPDHDRAEAWIRTHVASLSVS